MTGSRRIAILGVGDVFMRDEGVGPHVLRVLQSHCDFPSHVVLHNVGKPGPELALFLAHYDAVILVHAVSEAGQPGDVRVYRKRQLLGVESPFRATPYDPAVLNALRSAETAGQCPREVLLVSVVPESAQVGYGLTACVRSAIAAAVSAVLAELYRLGARVGARPEVSEPSLWEEQKVPTESAF